LRDVKPFLAYTGVIKGLLNFENQKMDFSKVLPEVVKYIQEFHLKDFSVSQKVLPDFSSELQEGIALKIKEVIGKKEINHDIEIATEKSTEK
jgi:hypothetical protein